MIYSSKTIDDLAGFDLQENGILKPRKYGKMVLNIDECSEILANRI